MNKGNVYESGAATLETESKRSAAMRDYFGSVSREAVGENIENKTILDLGAGKDRAFGDWVRSRGATYIPLDIREDFLKEQKKAGMPAVFGTAAVLPFKNDSIDIVHTKVVLMHLPFKFRERVIQEAIRVARKKAVFIELDWSSFWGNKVISDFAEVMEQIFPLLHATGFMGAKLQKEVERVVSLYGFEASEKKISERKRGNYYKEFLPVLRGLKGIIEKMIQDGSFKEEHLAKKFMVAAEAVEKEAQKEKPALFTPPKVVVVEVLKNS